MEVFGYQLALLEVFLFFLVSLSLKTHRQLKNIPGITYFWTMFTIMTGIWELAFVSNYKFVLDKAEHLIVGKEHVWTENYTLGNLNPKKFSILFYAEYGAYADREYMTVMDNWSRVIESSHCLMCGLFCLLAIGNKMMDNIAEYYIALSIAMGSQLMNSILYMVNYFHQTRDTNNINYANTSFPCGKYLEHRGFMYVNIFWTIMPLYVILYLLRKFKNLNISSNFGDDSKKSIDSKVNKYLLMETRM